MEEIWKDCKHYEGLYEVSSIGRVRNKRTGRIRKQYVESNGYCTTCLSKFGITRKEYIHRLVALTFIDNPDNKPQVNHVDGDKLNNEVTNLEWATAKENIRHAWDNGLSHSSDLQKEKAKKLCRELGLASSKSVRCVETNTIYPSAREAYRQTSIHYSHIGKCCRGKYNTAGGFHWEYVD